MDGWAHEFRRAGRAIAVIALVVGGKILVFHLLLHTLQVVSQLLFEGIKTSIATIVCTSRAWARRIETSGLGRGRHRWALLTVVNTLGIGRDVAEGEIQPAGTGLLQLDPQVLQVASLEALIELEESYCLDNG